MIAPVQDCLSSARILVIDDHEDSRNIARLVLEHAGYRVTQAANGAEGLERAFRELPDLVLADLILPQVDGLAVAERLRLHPATSNVRIIAMTADARPAAREEALRAGCNDFLAKPFPLSALRSIVLEQLLLAQMHARSRLALR
jgi:CheY-like chemotaxis protein